MTLYERQAGVNKRHNGHEGPEKPYASGYGCCLKDEINFSSDGFVISVDTKVIWQMILAVCTADFPCILNYFYSKGTTD